MMNVESIARELYRLPPAQFTAARNARAKQIAAAGDRGLADGVHALAKASAAAWAVNQVSADQPNVKHEVVQLGETLREAQEHPDRQTLTELSEQRKALVRRATNLAVEGAERDDVGVSDAARAEIEQTFFAAVADSRAAAAVFSGRLIRALQSTGFEEVDTSGAVGGPEPARIVPVAGGAADARGGRSGSKSAESAKGKAAAAESETAVGAGDAEAEAAEVAAARRRAHDEAGGAAEAARRAADDAAQKAGELADTLSGHDREAREVAAEIDDLESQLQALHDRQRKLGAQQRRAEREHRDAVTAARRAARDADEAAARAADLA